MRPDAKSEQLPPTDLKNSTPRERWEYYFRRNKPRPNDVRDLVSKMHKSRNHEEVIAVIEAALIGGQSQPWMYDVLAISMKLANRPEAEVERVLMSRVDFTATDVPNMLLSAAYLSRFGADTAALSLYRQGAALAPERPEGWIRALRLAKELNDVEAIQECVAGVLTHGWVGDHERLHREATNVARDTHKWLLSEGRTGDASKLAEAVREASARDLSLKLTWNGEGDLDLIVEEPLGTRCWRNAPYSRGGGVLLHDGSGPNQKNCFDEYVCPLGAPGTYRVKIRHVRGEVVGKRAQLVVTRYSGTDQEVTHKVTIKVAAEDVVVRVPLKNGRRTEVSPAGPQGAVTMERLLPRKLAPSRKNAAASRSAARRFQHSRDNGGNKVGFVGFQPVIQLVNEGVQLNAQAVVSADRRYVRLSLSPTFSSLLDVATFSFVNGGNGGQGGTAGAGIGN